MITKIFTQCFKCVEKGIVNPLFLFLKFALYNFKNKKRAFSSERRIKMKETKKEKKIIESNIVIVPDLSLIYSELYSNVDREKINNALAECKRLKREGLF